MKNYKLVLRVFFFLCFFALFCFSSFKIFVYIKDSNSAKNLRDEMISEAVVSLPAEEEGSAESVSPYLDIRVDLSALKHYPGVVGWLYSPKTPIHYPVMQSEDNEYYVHRLPDGSVNPAGSLFVDFRNDANLKDFGQIIYGHNMKNQSMFATLLNYRDHDYYVDHPFMFYFTSDSVYFLEIFAGVNTMADSDFYFLPDEKEDREEYLKMAKELSVFKSSVQVDSEDKILVLSTCSTGLNKPDRFVLLGKLVLIEKTK